MNDPTHISGYWREYPHKILQAFSAPSKVIGDSRLGHSMIAAGRPIKQDLEIINEAITDHSFFKNRVLAGSFAHARKFNGHIHLLGMTSDNGIHSHINHLLALLELASRENFKEVYIDAISDGVDSGPMEALKFIEKIRQKIAKVGLGKFSSICGRSFAMDRNKHYEKIIACYKMLVQGQAEKALSIEKAISRNYQEGRTDEFIKPTLIENDGKITTIKPNDGIIFFNFRPDRARQITEIFVNLNFRRFFWKPQIPENVLFATFTRYSKRLNTQVAFPREPLTGILPEILGRYQKRDLRVAESEKRAHVTYFFNGGREEPYTYEEHRIFASPEVESFDKTPAMSGGKITQEVLKAISADRHDFILVNFANVDMIAHTGNIIAAGKAVLEVDEFVREIVEGNLKKGGVTIITADHGNVEQMIKIQERHEEHLGHTFNPVPFILIAHDLKKDLIRGALSTAPTTLSKIITAKETLADIAPTILELMNLPKPEVMTGHSLLGKLE